jgi:hypothetical protein
VRRHDAAFTVPQHVTAFFSTYALCFGALIAQDSHIPFLAVPPHPYVGIMLPHSKAASCWRTPKGLSPQWQRENETVRLFFTDN